MSAVGDSSVHRGFSSIKQAQKQPSTETEVAAHGTRQSHFFLFRSPSPQYLLLSFADSFFPIPNTKGIITDIQTFPSVSVPCNPLPIRMTVSDMCSASYRS